MHDGRRDLAGGGRLRPSAAAPFDLLLMDLNYTGDTTSGREGIDLLVARPGARSRCSPIVVMTGLGIGRPRGRSDAARRARLRAEAVGQRTAASRRCAPKIDAGRARRQQLAARAARARRGAAHPAQAAARHAAADRRAGRSPRPGSPRRGRRRLLRRDRVRSSRASRLSIADVVGKGIPAALLMSNLQAAVRAFATDATAARTSSASRSTASCAATSPRDASSPSSTASSTATTRHADVRERRSLPADPRARRRRGGAPDGPAAPVLGVFPDGDLRTGRVRAPQRRSARPLHRRHHRRAQRRRTRSSAKSG